MTPTLARSELRARDFDEIPVFAKSARVLVDVEARARAAVWCSPGTTIGIGVGIDLLDVTDRSAFATLAGQLDPYDHPR